MAIDKMTSDVPGLSDKESLPESSEQKTAHTEGQHGSASYDPPVVEAPTLAWLNRAYAFVLESHERLFNQSEGFEYAKSRGLTKVTMWLHRLGWVCQDRWEPAASWGLDSQTGHVWIPAGLVIPSFQWAVVPQKIKIRRLDGKPKYVAISGSRKQFSVYGDSTLPIVLVESEIDAILLRQEIGDLCCIMALGGVNNRPDRDLHLLLRQRTILWSLDNDQAAEAEFQWWDKHYPKLYRWQSPQGKSPSEAYGLGVKLDEWIKDGLSMIERKT